MDIGDLPIFAMLKSRLGYLSDRQKVIAENVANANTPNYKARDLKPFSFEAQVKAASSPVAMSAASSGGMAVTQPGHMQPPGGEGMSSSASAVTKMVKSPDSEETLDGNGVVLEDEMVKLTDNRLEYETAIGFYQQSMGLLKTALRRPGAGA